MVCEGGTRILTPNHAHIELECRFRMLLGLREKTNSRLCDNKQADMVGNADITRELCPKGHLEKVVRAVNLRRDKQKVAYGDSTAFPHRCVEMSIADKESENRVRRRY